MIQIINNNFFYVPCLGQEARRVSDDFTHQEAEERGTDEGQGASGEEGV